MNTVYFALTGDMVSSRSLSNRAEAQRTLRSSIDSLNPRLEGLLAAPLKIVAGDEIQGLFVRPEGIVEVVTEISDALHPVAMMWGVGAGSLSTDLADDVSVVDGPCLHRARKALESAASDERWLVARGIAEPHADVLSTLFHLTWSIRSGWTDTQMKYILAARTRLQTQVADSFGVTRQAVSKALDSAHMQAVLGAEDAASSYLRWIGSRVDALVTDRTD